MNQKSGAAAARPANRAMTLLLVATVGATLLRIALAARIPLGDDEGYYLLWARHLAWGYPDHPPMIAVVIALGARVFGGSPLAIRILPLLMASATPLLLYAAGRDIFDAAAGRRAALLLLGLPAYTLGATVASPAAPLSLPARRGPGAARVAGPRILRGPPRRGGPHRPDGLLVCAQRLDSVSHAAPAVDRGCAGGAPAPALLDRKSTRLNSSHG